MPTSSSSIEQVLCCSWPNLTSYGFSPIVRVSNIRARSIAQAANCFNTLTARDNTLTSGTAFGPGATSHIGHFERGGRRGGRRGSRGLLAHHLLMPMTSASRIRTESILCRQRTNGASLGKNRVSSFLQRPAYRIAEAVNRFPALSCCCDLSSSWTLSCAGAFLRVCTRRFCCSKSRRLANR